jgi:hypothetical protein
MVGILCKLQFFVVFNQLVHKNFNFHRFFQQKLINERVLAQLVTERHFFIIIRGSHSAVNQTRGALQGCLLMA